MTSAPPPRRQPVFNLPPTTKALVAANLLVFAAMWLMSDAAADAIIGAFGFTPDRYMAALSWTAIVAPLTYQFLHAGFAHVGVNMLSLVAFGAGVELRLGRWRMLVFYLLCGVAGAAVEFLLDPASNETMIGASAAISGLFGAILRFRVFRGGFWTLVVLWFVMNAVTGIAGVGSEAEPIAWVAHIGGFVAGLVLFPIFARGR